MGLPAWELKTDYISYDQDVGKSAVAGVRI